MPWVSRAGCKDALRTLSPIVNMIHNNTVVECAGARAVHRARSGASHTAGSRNPHRAHEVGRAQQHAHLGAPRCIRRGVLRLDRQPGADDREHGRQGGRNAEEAQTARRAAGRRRRAAVRDRSCEPGPAQLPIPTLLVLLVLLVLLILLVLLVLAVADLVRPSLPEHRNRRCVLTALPAPP